MKLHEIAISLTKAMARERLSRCLLGVDGRVTSGRRNGSSKEWRRSNIVSTRRERIKHATSPQKGDVVCFDRQQASRLSIVLMMTFLVLSPGLAQEPPASALASASAQLLVTALEPVSVLREAIVDGRLLGEDPVFTYERVQHTFVHGEGSGQLEIAIHPTEHDAIRAYQRTLPQSVVCSFRDELTQGCVSHKASHLRFRNLVLLISFDQHTDENELLDLADRLLVAIGEGDAATFGTQVDTPVVQLEKIKRKAGRGSNELAAFVFGVEPDRRILLHHSEEGKSRRVGIGRHEQWVQKAWLDSEPVLRVARPTGEVFEVSLTEARAAKVAMITERELKKAPLKLAPQTKARAMGQLTANLAQPRAMLSRVERHQLQKAVRSLATAPSADVEPFFRQILESDHDSVTKKLALPHVIHKVNEITHRRRPK